MPRTWQGNHDLQQEGWWKGVKYHLLQSRYSSVSTIVWTIFSQNRRRWRSDSIFIFSNSFLWSTLSLAARNKFPIHSFMKPYFIVLLIANTRDLGEWFSNNGDKLCSEFNQMEGDVDQRKVAILSLSGCLLNIDDHCKWKPSSCRYWIVENMNLLSRTGLYVEPRTVHCRRQYLHTVK